MDSTTRTARSSQAGGDRRSTRGRSVMGVVATLAALVAVGCSGEDLAERAIENQIEREGGGDVDIDLDSGEIRIETEDGVVEMNTDGDGNVSIDGEGVDGNISIDSEDGVTVIEGPDGSSVIETGGTDIPDDFPSTIPLPDGFTPQFTQSADSGGVTGWILGGEMDGSVSDIAEPYFAALEAAGFERTALTESPDSAIFVYDDGTYSVNGLIGADTSGATYVNLTIAQAAG